MRLLPRSLKWRTTLLTLLGLIAIGVSVWWTFRADITAFVKRQQLLQKMRDCRLPLDNALGNEDLRTGMPVEEWVAAHPPKSRTRHDEYDTLMYEGSARRGPMRVIAMGGVIVFAKTDFGYPDEALTGSLSPSEYAAYMASLRRWSARRLAGLAAVGGIAPLGNQDRWEFPTPFTYDLRVDP